VRTATHRVPQPHLRVLFSNDHGPPTPHHADPGAPSGAGHAGQVRAPPGPAGLTAARISHQGWPGPTLGVCPPAQGPLSHVR
jgi:hypothetical protein